ncbi:16S rRNA (uracil(1498)-N(3))-methyltransferase [Pseudoclavibacter soli]|uniref:16S rRNA (uracil(1498)-N(3))-methyltransferase n=1 Tax=Pseudoclavibacter soli TaxID=452623 RepID=UPI0004143FAD|nr:16S rRNA (uracil(1498)-N(3))-methyltransferase [Pseudoclavibacter soli]
MALFLPEGVDWATPVGAEISFSGDEARHAATVRRLHPGEIISLADGYGLELVGEITTADRKQVSLRVTDRIEHPAPTEQIRLVQALAKGGRDELAVQAATEAGVDAVTPWQARRSVSVWAGQAKQLSGIARWRSVAREAAKQSLRARTPTVDALLDSPGLLAAVAAWVASGASVLVLEPTAGVPLSTVPLSPGHDVVLIVGPEGGIDDAELAALDAAGARRVLLGPSVLRTSNAGLAGIALVNAALGRW